MLNRNTFKLIGILITFALLLNGCGTVETSTVTDREEIPVPAGPQVEQEPISLPPPTVQPEQQASASVQADSLLSVNGAEKTTESAQLEMDYDSIEFVRRRLRAYEKKFEQWLAISEMTREATLAEEITALETECIGKLERILSGYGLLLDKLRLGDTAADDDIDEATPQEMQELDILFLESRCAELLGTEMPADQEFVPEDAPELSFAAAQEIIASHVEAGNYQEALSAYEQLALNFPGREPSAETRLNYGLALQYTGQIEAAAIQYKNILGSDAPRIRPLSLQRQTADLMFAGGELAAAEAFYQRVIRSYNLLGAEKGWAEEQLAFLQNADPASEEMNAYMQLLREFQMYDYRVDAPRLNEAVHDFTARYAGSPLAREALRLKTFALNRLKAWFGRQLVRIDALVAEKRFTEATDILRNMGRYYLPAELQAVVQKTYYEVAQTEMQEMETQRRMQEMELNEQWEAAINHLDSQRYELAISAFEALSGTEYEEEANRKITEAANEAAGQMRKEAASLFIRAGRTPDPEQKKKLLLASHALLTEILQKYPQTDLLDKVQQNIGILEVQIERFAPGLLEELPEEDPAEPGTASPGPYTEQLR